MLWNDLSISFQTRATWVAKALQKQWASGNTFGGHKAVVRPVPIPNTAVKLSLADGSGCIASARVGCRQIFIINRHHSFCGAGFLFGTIRWRLAKLEGF